MNLLKRQFLLLFKIFIWIKEYIKASNQHLKHRKLLSLYVVSILILGAYSWIMLHLFFKYQQLWLNIFSEKNHQKFMELLATAKSFPNRSFCLIMNKTYRIPKSNARNWASDKFSYRRVLTMFNDGLVFITMREDLFEAIFVIILKIVQIHNMPYSRLNELAKILFKEDKWIRILFLYHDIFHGQKL